MAAEDLGATEGQVGLAGGSIRAHHFLPAKQYCTNLSPIESILQYRFATPKPLKARPGPEGMQNRSFVQPFPPDIPFWGPVLRQAARCHQPRHEAEIRPRNFIQARPGPTAPPGA